MKVYILVQGRGDYSDHTTKAVRVYSNRVLADKAEAALATEAHRRQTEYTAWNKSTVDAYRLELYPPNMLESHNHPWSTSTVEGNRKREVARKYAEADAEARKPSQIMLELDPTCEIWDDWYVEECEAYLEGIDY